QAPRTATAVLVKWLSVHTISLCFLPTALAEDLVGKQLPADLSLRYLLTGGDKFHQTPPKSLPFTLVNHYGPTESTVVATSATITAGTESHASPPIGRPIANTEMCLRDAHLQAAPIGGGGEL